MTRNIYIQSTGSYLPQKVLTNEDLSKFLDTSDDWITQRTGIKTRHIAESTEMSSDMGAEAAVKALFKAEISPNEVDLIICATSTPDLTFPATATLIQRKLEIDQTIAFDIGQAACNGFLTALYTANALMRTNPSLKKALVIGTEMMSRLLDWSDRSTCVLFGDGAGCALLSATDEERGLIDTQLYNQSKYGDTLYTNGGVGQTADAGQIIMNGRAVFKEAVLKLAQAAEDLLKKHKISTEELKWFIPHQANARIIKATAEHLNLPLSKVIMTVEHHANTSAASIPLALDDANEKGLLQKGDLILLDALGAGMSWGASLMRW